VPEPERARTVSEQPKPPAPAPACPSVLADVSSALPMEAPWRTALVDFAKEEVKHPAWGFAHSKRNFLVSMQIARIEKLTVDEDVLFAAAFLHDLGGLARYKQEGVDHAVRSAELVDEILVSRGFPSEKVPKVKTVILAHTYYNPEPPSSPEATVFRDADILDFLGAIGFARIASLTGRETPDLAGSARMSRKLNTELPAKLITKVAQCNGRQRAAFLGNVLDALQDESLGGKHL